MKKLTLLIALAFTPSLALAALLEGMIEKVDKDKKQIVLKTDKGQETVEFDDATKGIDKVKAGSRVTVTYSQKGEKLQASEIVAAGAGGPQQGQGAQRDRPAGADAPREKIPPVEKIPPGLK
jgi:hypothetical protein